MKRLDEWIKESLAQAKKRQRPDNGV